VHQILEQLVNICRNSSKIKGWHISMDHSVYLLVLYILFERMHIIKIKVGVRSDGCVWLNHVNLGRL